MAKKILALLLALTLCAGILCACSDLISESKAIKIALKDAGFSAADSESHTHYPTEHDGKVCYEVGITCGEESWTYYIEMTTGQIIGKTAGSHSH